MKNVGLQFGEQKLETSHGVIHIEMFVRLSCEGMNMSNISYGRSVYRGEIGAENKPEQCLVEHNSCL